MRSAAVCSLVPIFGPPTPGSLITPGFRARAAFYWTWLQHPKPIQNPNLWPDHAVQTLRAAPLHAAVWREGLALLAYDYFMATGVTPAMDRPMKGC